jgi:hypothetical protein
MVMPHMNSDLKQKITPFDLFKHDMRHLKKRLISAQRHQMLSSCPFLKSPSSKIKKQPDISSDFVTWWH